MFQRVPLEVGDQNFAGATYRKLKFYGCLAPVAPVLTRPLPCSFHAQAMLLKKSLGKRAGFSKIVEGEVFKDEN